MVMIFTPEPGAEPEFSFRGTKDYVRSCTSRERTLKCLTTGVQGPQAGPGSSRGFLMLSHAI